MTLMISLGISEQAFYRWKEKNAGMDVGEVWRLMQLKEEHRKFKKPATDLSLDKRMLQNMLSPELLGLLCCANR